MRGQEFRCTEETAMRVQAAARPAYAMSPFDVALGIPVVVSEDVPVGKFQLWQDGKFIKEVDAP